MQLLLSQTPAIRGIQGAGIMNGENFGNLITINNLNYPVFNAWTSTLSEPVQWSCSLPMIARVVDNNDNSRLDEGDLVLMIVTSTGDSNSPFVSSVSAVDVFNLPASTPYFGTGMDGALVIDGTFSANSTDGHAYPGGQLSAPANPAVSQTSGSGFASGTSLIYQVAAVDAYGGTTQSTSINYTVTGTGISTITLTWNGVTGAQGYNVYRSSDGGNTYALMSSPVNSITDSGSGNASSTIIPPSTNTSDGSYRIDSVMNYSSVTVQNNGVISCTHWTRPVNNSEKS